ncbi:MAG: hypothetical protein AABY55_06885 [Candidatus Omnitrophota bacterium]
MQKALKEYSIVWMVYEKTSKIARQVMAPGDITLPYLVSAENPYLDEFSLLTGLLIMYFTHPPMSVTHKIKPYFKDILISLLEQFKKHNGYSSTKQVIMVICAYLKEEYRESLSKKALKAGLEIIPESLRIKSALLQLEDIKNA